jgi:hypothetical protein
VDGAGAEAEGEGCGGEGWGGVGWGGGGGHLQLDGDDGEVEDLREWPDLVVGDERGDELLPHLAHALVEEGGQAADSSAREAEAAVEGEGDTLKEALDDGEGDEGDGGHEAREDALCGARRGGSAFEGFRRWGVVAFAGQGGWCCSCA